jgi:6-phosphogluconolactonase (cycloisomerase 2 family)
MSQVPQFQHEDQEQHAQEVLRSGALSGIRKTAIQDRPPEYLEIEESNRLLEKSMYNLGRAYVYGKSGESG